MKSLLVTGAGGSAGHNVCWSLRTSRDGKKLAITGTDSDRTNLQLNNWIDTAYHLPRAGDPKYISSINKVVQNEKIEGILPQPDPELAIISEHRDSVRASTFLPDQETVRKCLDKYESLKKWSSQGLRENPTILSSKDRDIESKLRQLNFPCWIRAREGAGGLLSSAAKDAETVNDWISFHWRQGINTDFVAEEYLPGRDYCFMSLWKEGNLVTSMVRERLSWVGHRLIGTGGTSRLNKVIHSEDVNQQSTKAILAISSRPHGVFCVDLKEDRDRQSHPTEINCRFTTNVHYLALASIRTGHQEWNFPWLAALIMLREPLPSCQKYDALPEDLSFTKNTDMGFTMVKGENWKAREL